MSNTFRIDEKVECYSKGVLLNVYVLWTKFKRKIKLILLHDNARSHVAKIVKETLLKLEWKVLPRPAYSSDFRSIQDALADTHFFSYEQV